MEAGVWIVVIIVLAVISGLAYMGLKQPTEAAQLKLLNNPQSAQIATTKQKSEKVEVEVKKEERTKKEKETKEKVKLLDNLDNRFFIFLFCFAALAALAYWLWDLSGINSFFLALILSIAITSWKGGSSK